MVSAEHHGSPAQPGRWGVGLWLGLAANGLAVVAGAVFLLAPPGARFRGMEPEARAFVVLSVSATLLGLMAGVPASVYDLCRPGRRLSGAAGVVLSLAPLPVAGAVSEVVAELLGLVFD